MNQKEALRSVLKQAQANGFPFRRWFQAHLRRSWPGSRRAFALLATEGRHYTLLFSHDFARYFWRTGTQISFAVPAMTYPRVNGQGGVVQVTRKPFTRRTNRPNVWKYHLSQMAIAEDPLAYICRFLLPQVALRHPHPLEPRPVQAVRTLYLDAQAKPSSFRM